MEHRYYLHSDAWRLSIPGRRDGLVPPLRAELGTLQHAAFRFAQPEIWNSDQGSPFTSADFLAPLKQRGISIRMDGRGRVLDNVFIERLWRSLQYD
jgi:transposase InsO family protein